MAEQMAIRTESSLMKLTADSIKVGFIGAGKMAQAMSHGFMTSGLVRIEDMIASAPNRQELREIQKSGVSLTTSNSEVVERSNVIILAVKPYNVLPVLEKLHDKLNPENHLLISIAAGISLAQIEKVIPASVPVIRVMPNTPALILSSATAYSLGASAKREHGQLVYKLFSSIGLCEEIAEKSMNAVTALSGSGPAYACTMIDAMSDGGVKLGLSRDLARTFAAQTLLGAAKMCLELNRHPAQIKDDVCSPGGCTISAIHELEKGNFRASIISAIEASAKRCYEMSEEENKN